MKDSASKPTGQPFVDVRPPREAVERSLSRRCGAALLDHLHQVFWQHKLHWLFVALIIGSFLYVGHKLEHHPGTLGMRYRMHRVMQNPWPRPLAFRDTVIVKIDDETFWHDLRGEEPLDREYLSKLIDKVAQGNPAVIALDVRLAAFKETAEPVESPSGRKILVHQDDVAAHECLFEKIREVSRKCSIVLPKRVSYAKPIAHGEGEGHHGESERHDEQERDASDNHNRPRYARRVDAYDLYGFDLDRVKPAYTILYDDSRTIPPALKMDDGTELDSFSLAAARQFRPELVDRKDWTVARIASFVARSEPDELSAHGLMTATGTDWQNNYSSRIKSKIVVIGGDWHKDAFGSGELRDSWDTPVGPLPGAVLHANYIEAILDDRSFDPFTLQWALLAIDGILGLLLAYVAVLRWNLWYKLPATLLIGLVPLAASLVVMQTLAIYWDVVVLYVILGLHLLVEKLIPSYAAH